MFVGTPYDFIFLRHHTARAESNLLLLPFPISCHYHCSLFLCYYDFMFLCVYFMLFIPDNSSCCYRYLLTVSDVKQILSYLSKHRRHTLGWLLLVFSWWCHLLETFFALLAICAGNSPVPGEFPTQSPVTRSFDICFDRCLNIRFSKQLSPQWFETQSRHTLGWLLLVFALWRHQMETFSALLAICAGNWPVPGEFPTQRPVTRNFDVYFDLRPNARSEIYFREKCPLKWS